MHQRISNLHAALNSLQLGDGLSEEAWALAVKLKHAMDNPSPQLLPEEKDLIEGQKKIQALNSVRVRLGLSLREAKDLVDSHRW